MVWPCVCAGGGAVCLADCGASLILSVSLSHSGDSPLLTSHWREDRPPSTGERLAPLCHNHGGTTMTSTPVRDSKRDLAQVWRNGKIIFHIFMRHKPAGLGLSHQDRLVLKTGGEIFHKTISPFLVSIPERKIITYLDKDFYQEILLDICC